MTKTESAKMTALTVLSDAQLEQLFASITHPPIPTTLRKIARAIELEVITRLAATTQASTAQAEAVDGVRWDLFPGYLIDHCEGDIISEEGLQFSVAAMLKDPAYLAACAATSSTDGALRSASETGSGDE